MRLTRRIDEIFGSYMDTQGIDGSASIVVAYSGGPDSTALLSLLAGFTEKKENITAAWYNHRLRSATEMSAEQALVERTSAALGLRLMCGSAADGIIEEKSARENLSVEECARGFRYKFLQSCAAETGADYIAAGHNLNDNAETMLMRFFTNSGIFGLSGVPERNGNIIRPLSSVPRGMIEEYLEETGLEYSIDSTNLESDFLRNRVRNELLPVIRKIFPAVEKNLQGLSVKFELNNDFLRRETSERLIWTRTERGYGIDAESFYSEHPILRICSVFSILNRIGIGGRQRYAAVEQAVSRPFPGNGRFLLKTGDFSIRTEDGHIFIRSLVNHNKKSYLLYLEPEQSFSIFGQTISVHHAEGAACSGVGKNKKSIILCSEGPLLARSYREGDKIRGAEGMKSLKKIFNEWRVFSEDRDIIPVIEADGNIMAVAGEHLGYRNRLSIDNGSDRTDKKIMLIFGIDTETTGE